VIEQFGWPFVVENGCRRPIEFMLQVRDANGAWESLGGYRFEPGERALMLRGEDRYLHTKYGQWRWRAETVDAGGNALVWQGTSEIEYRGQTFKAIEKIQRESVSAFQAHPTCDAR